MASKVQSRAVKSQKEPPQRTSRMLLHLGHNPVLAATQLHSHTRTENPAVHYHQLQSLLVCEACKGKSQKAALV